MDFDWKEKHHASGAGIHHRRTAGFDHGHHGPDHPALVALKSARKGAERTETANLLRQIIAAYTAYHHEHNGRLLPGYVDPSLLVPDPTTHRFLDLKAKHESGTLLNDADTSCWVWRLAPYYDYNWEALMTDYRSPALLSRLDGEYSGGAFAGSGGVPIDRTGGDTLQFAKLDGSIGTHKPTEFLDDETASNEVRTNQMIRSLSHWSGKIFWAGE